MSHAAKDFAPKFLKARVRDTYVSATRDNRPDLSEPDVVALAAYLWYCRSMRSKRNWADYAMPQLGTHPGILPWAFTSAKPETIARYRKYLEAAR